MTTPLPAPVRQIESVAHLTVHETSARVSQCISQGSKIAFALINRGTSPWIILILSAAVVAMFYLVPESNRSMQGITDILNTFLADSMWMLVSAVLGTLLTISWLVFVIAFQIQNAHVRRIGDELAGYRTKYETSRASSRDLKKLAEYPEDIEKEFNPEFVHNKPKSGS